MPAPWCSQSHHLSQKWAYPHLSPPLRREVCSCNINITSSMIMSTTCAGTLGCNVRSGLLPQLDVRAPRRHCPCAAAVKKSHTTSSFLSWRHCTINMNSMRSDMRTCGTNWSGKLQTDPERLSVQNSGDPASSSPQHSVYLAREHLPTRSTLGTPMLRVGPRVAPVAASPRRERTPCFHAQTESAGNSRR